jgi:hypothetical protein
MKPKRYVIKYVQLSLDKEGTAKMAWPNYSTVKTEHQIECNKDEVDLWLSILAESGNVDHFLTTVIDKSKP